MSRLRPCNGEFELNHQLPDIVRHQVISRPDSLPQKLQQRPSLTERQRHIHEPTSHDYSH